jgi:deoxyribodipyrimidine photolyase-related protein
MAESDEEAGYVWSTKARIAIFLAAMRHFRDEIAKKGFTVDYHALGETRKPTSFGTELARAVKELKPSRLIVVEPGEWRVRETLAAKARELDLELEVRADRHFFCTHADFEEFAEGRKQLRLEYFYRQMRRKLDILMDGREPVGGEWNYDTENRQSFGKDGPGDLPEPKSFRPDKVTREVIALVEERFADHPGSLERFDWPVTRRQARAALDEFIENRLAGFGPYEDAMWTGEPYVYHSRLSNVINVHLLDPRDAVAAAVQAHKEEAAPIQSVEAFVRQLIGWREFIRGIYWKFMPDYEHMNALGQDAPLPSLYWTGETDMACLRECVTQTLDLGFAHHIQRLMVTGLFAQLFGSDPHEVHKWYLAVYVDAVEWVELPNVLGMSQFADGGLMASKPYAATGKYIDRMSNYCAGCRYKPKERTGEHACPFTVLYWDFLMRHEKLLGKNPRMALQVRNIDRLDRSTRRAIRSQAERLRSELLADRGAY